MVLMKQCNITSIVVRASPFLRSPSNSTTYQLTFSEQCRKKVVYCRGGINLQKEHSSVTLVLHYKELQTNDTSSLNKKSHPMDSLDSVRFPFSLKKDLFLFYKYTITKESCLCFFIVMHTKRVRASLVILLFKHNPKGCANNK